jgi:pyrimidine operon attenuation protein/uracil phosphoribosyltransferase
VTELAIEAPHFLQAHSMTMPQSPQSVQSPVLVAPDAEAVYANLKTIVAARLAACAPGSVAIVGIHTGGAWVAQRLHHDLCLDAPLGFLSSAFHRDDYSARGLRTRGEAGKTSIDFMVDDADILLIDDVLFTGRTVRAAINELFDYGRPRSVELAVLVDRGGRQLPVHAALAGLRTELIAGQSMRLKREEDGRFALKLEAR